MSLLIVTVSITVVTQRTVFRSLIVVSRTHAHRSASTTVTESCASVITDSQVQFMQLLCRCFVTTQDCLSL